MKARGWPKEFRKRASWSSRAFARSAWNSTSCYWIVAGRGSIAIRKSSRWSDDGTAEITLTIDQPVPHGIADNKKAVLYAFEEADVQKKGQYLGEFTASGVDDKKSLLTPTAKLTAREINRLKKLAKTKGPWVLYEMLPRDSHELFAGLGDEQLKAMLPAGSSAGVSQGRQAGRPGRSQRARAGRQVRPAVARLRRLAGRRAGEVASC